MKVQYELSLSNVVRHSFVTTYHHRFARAAPAPRAYVIKNCERTSPVEFEANRFKIAKGCARLGVQELSCPIFYCNSCIIFEMWMYFIFKRDSPLGITMPRKRWLRSRLIRGRLHRGRQIVTKMWDNVARFHF